MKCYYCELCGNLFEIIDDSGVNTICCGQKMSVVKENNDDSAAKEKHVPVVQKEGFITKVKVGETYHPMSKEHYIEWIEVETDKGIYRKYLNADEKPEVEFIINEAENIKNVYAYCNLHGLWAC